MNLCSDNHDEVCFETRLCPACEVAKEKNREISKLEQTNGEQLDDIHDLQKEIVILKENQAG